MSYQKQMIFLGKGGFDIVSNMMDSVLLKVVEQAHANSLEVFKDSFGANHSLECSSIGVNWVERIWDRN